MNVIKRLTVAQAFRIVEDEVSGCLTRKPPQPTVSAQSSLVRADACEGAVRDEAAKRGLLAALGSQESTFMRFQVEIDVTGFPEDDGEALAAEIKKALTDAASDFDTNAKVEETTE